MSGNSLSVRYTGGGGGETHNEKSDVIIAAKKHQAIAPSRGEIDNDTER